MHHISLQEREVELNEVVGNIVSVYEGKCYSAVLACIKRSMAVLRRRMCASSGSGALVINQVKYLYIQPSKTRGNRQHTTFAAVFHLSFLAAIFSSRRRALRPQRNNQSQS